MDDKRDYFGEKSGANTLTWYETKRAYDEGDLVFYVDRGLAIQAAASGIEVGILGVLYAIAVPIVFIAGIILAFFSAWWWFFVGIKLAVVCFKLSRQTAVKAVRKAAFLNEGLFHLFRDKKIIWFERR